MSRSDTGLRPRSSFRFSEIYACARLQFVPARHQDVQGDDSTALERTARRIERHWFVVLLGIGVLVAGAISQVLGFASEVWGYAQSRYAWRSDEYEILDGLVPGSNLDSFAAGLGEVTIKREHEGGAITELLYKRRDHWVQALVDPADTVRAFAVVSCDPSFRPVFDATFYGAAESIALQDTVLAEATDTGSYEYFVSGAAAPSTLLEYLPGGNPRNYQTVFWGSSDVCGGVLGDKHAEWFEPIIGLDDHDPDSNRFVSEEHQIGTLPSEFESLRSKTPVILYGETMNDFDLTDLPKTVILGGNYQDTRLFD